MLIINLSVIYFYDVESSRIIRLVSTILFFLFFILNKGYNKSLLLIAFALFLVSDICMLRYEELIFNRLTFLTTILAYSFIAIHIFPKIKLLKNNKWVFIIFSLVLIVNTLMLNELIHMVEFKLIDKTHEILFYVYGVAMIVMGLFAANYNFRYNSTQSTLCMYFVLGFILSDIFAVMAYYLNFEVFYFPDRIFYILGISVLVSYSVLELDEEVLYDDEIEE